ncbi:glutamyl-tRNA(Gln) amidotransferase subunit C, mitochondrial [Polyergus mexicanus]|uniref:glutamyl-tRNA(Gln) amidotransferase subunit C, mitochondrial n=1 Tax=Polyergus mexicanus TaxID=615972 RepID=UPI0038B5161A
MHVLRWVCKLFDRSVIIPLHPIASSKTYRSSTVQAKQQQQQEVENINDRARGDERPVIDEATIRRLERLALVGFEYEQSKRILEEAITFAERLRTARIDETVRPMYSTLENDRIRLRDDVVRNNVDRREILRNAAVLEEEYFVAPLATTKSDSGR